MTIENLYYALGAGSIVGAFVWFTINKILIEPIKNSQNTIQAESKTGFSDVKTSFNQLSNKIDDYNNNVQILENKVHNFDGQLEAWKSKGYELVEERFYKKTGDK